MSQNTFTIIISESKLDSWPDVVWTDAKNVGAKVFLNYCKSIGKTLRKLRKIHFANPVNKRIWLPMKTIWDWSNALKLEDLDPDKRNYIIFQTGIKFSAHYIKRLKKERNACIVLYMPDNIQTMRIANTKKEFERYCKYYHVDQVYSFDKKDCEDFGMEFFDFYSKLPIETSTLNKQKYGKNIFYVGGCRSEERLKILHSLYDKLNDTANCTFYLNGVQQEAMTNENIHYNTPLTYKQVIELVLQNDIIVEIMNGQQAGNTLRLKEAVCYNKRLLTNNPNVINSQYYNPEYMQYFENVEDINVNWINRDVEVDYHYQGEFSPQRLLELIIRNDSQK